MTTFAVIDRATGSEVFRYNAPDPIEWDGFGFATHDHQPVTVVEVVAAPPAPPREFARLEFLRRFTPAERILAREARKTDPLLNDFFALLEAADIVHSNDPDVRLGLSYMTQNGYLVPGRSAEILGDV